MTIGDLIAGKDYRVVAYCGYDAEKRTAKSFQTIKHMTNPSQYYSSQSRLKKSL